MDTFKNAVSIASFAGKTAVFAANATRRYVSAARHGVCIVCNNLQPHGHERTFGRSEAPWEKNEWANKAELIKTPTLVLEDILALDILNSRRIDDQTGKPKNDCAYCRLLCDIFDS